MALVVLLTAVAALAQPVSEAAERQAGGEASLVLPDLSQVTFLGGLSGPAVLSAGLVMSGLGLLFGLVSLMRLRRLPVHRSLAEVSELI